MAAVTQSPALSGFTHSDSLTFPTDRSPQGTGQPAGSLGGPRGDPSPPLPQLLAPGATLCFCPPPPPAHPGPRQALPILPTRQAPPCQAHPLPCHPGRTHIPWVGHRPGAQQTVGTATRWQSTGLLGAFPPPRGALSSTPANTPRLPSPEPASHSEKLMFPSSLTHRREHAKALPTATPARSSPAPWGHCPGQPSLSVGGGARRPGPSASWGPHLSGQETEAAAGGAWGPSSLPGQR